MKNFKVFKLLALFVVLITSIPQVKAWYLTAYGPNWGGWHTVNIGTGEYTWYNVNVGTFYYKLGSTESNWSGGDLVQNKKTWDDHKSLKESDMSLTSGQMTINLPENSNVTIKYAGSGSDWKVNVYVRPAYYFKYDWNNDGWKWSAWLVSCGDGTYATEGQYKSTCTSFNYDTQDRGSGTGEGSCSNIIRSGDNLSNGLKCFFIYNPDIANSGASRSLTIEEKNSTSGTNYIFFDNTNASWADASIQAVLGHLSYSRTYAMSKVGSSDYTNLYYVSRSGNDWTSDGCFAYFGMIGGASKFDDGAWASKNMYDANHYSRPLYKHQNLSNGYNYLISKANNTNGDPITVEEKGNGYSSLNFAQTVQYALSTNGGSSYPTMSSGNTPAQITGSSYAFNARTTVTETSLAAALSANGTRYSTTISAAYTGKTTLTMSSKRDGYTFIGWYDGNTQKATTASYTYRPTSTNTITARFKAHRYTIAYNANDAQYVGTAIGSTASNTNVVYDQNQTLRSNGFSRTGYTFAGWNSKADGSGISYTDGQSVSNLSSSDGATVTLYARWTPITYSITYKDKGDESFSGSHVDSPSSHPTSHTYATATSLNSATKVGYTFSGWFTNENCTGTAVTSLGATAYTADITLYAKWTPVTLTFKSDASTSAWGTATNWNPACVPTIEHEVVLKKSAVVSGGTTAAAKSVKIDCSSSAVKLTIESTGALIVAQDIKAKHEDEDSYGATNENDLRIESNASGNGTLIVGNASTNTMASYQAYSKSWYVSGYGYINQYIGIPFDELYAYQYYGRILYEYDGEYDRWKASSTTMEAFKAYNILSKTDSYDYFYLDGTLNLPGKDGAGRLQTLTCGSRTGNGTNDKGDYMFANSWTAPIYITAMTAADFDGVAQAIYIFNAGSNKGGTDAPDALGENPGQWTAITLADVGSSTLKVIPSTQAFLVKNTASGGTLTLDYNKHVFAPAKASIDAGDVISTEPIRAPKHEQTYDNPSTRLNIIVRSDSIYSDYVRIHERADFTNGYDDGWEAAKIFGIAAAPQLYAISDIGRMAVNAVPEIEGMVIGFTKGSSDDTYTMSFEYDGEEALYLNDLKEQISTLIAADNSYQFISAANDTEARFVISRTPIAHTPTGVSDINNQQSAARKLMIEGKLYIIRDGGIYDATGTMVK